MNKLLLGLLCLTVHPLSLFAQPAQTENLTASHSPFYQTSIESHKTIRKITLHHISASDFIQAIKKQPGLVDSSVQLAAILHPQQAWCRGTATQCESLQAWAHLLDKPQPQVILRAKIISIDRNQVRSLGLDFKTITADSNQLHNDLPQLSSQNGSALITLAKTGNNQLLTLEIAALERQGQARVIAQPSLITKDQQAAIIESGEEVPYQQNTSSGATNIAFKKAVLRLSVTPTIISKSRIDCRIDIHQDKVTPINVNGVPIIHTQHIQTRAQINNRHTLVLGGIINQDDESNLQSIPGIRHIPLLGKLLSHKQQRHSRRTLYIFITPQLAWP